MRAFESETQYSLSRPWRFICAEISLAGLLHLYNAGFLISTVEAARSQEGMHLKVDPGYISAGWGRVTRLLKENV